MDKQLIEIIAKSPEAASAIGEYINYLYFNLVFKSATLIFIFGGLGYLGWKIYKAETSQ